jgi:hypothetical protein
VQKSAILRPSCIRIVNVERFQLRGFDDLIAFTRLRWSWFQREGQREDDCLRRMFCGRDRLGVNIQCRSQRGMPQQLLHHFDLCSDA